MEIKIEKLPLMGSPYSFKTKKQGRRKSMDALLKEKPRKRKKSFLEIELPKYKGDNKFLLSIKDQLQAGGIESLSMKQITVDERVFKSLKPRTLQHSKELSRTYKRIISN